MSPIPVHFFAGRHAYVTPGELAEEYYNFLEAPAKSFTWFENSAHILNWDEPDKTAQELIRIAYETLSLFEVGACLTTLATPLPIEFEYKGSIPTGFDGINMATCTFTKPVETVTVTLGGPANHTELFTLAEPTTKVSFPLPEGILSITTLEIVPPGEYQRKMAVTSVDGETLVISDQPGVLTTVTILESGTVSHGGPVTDHVSLVDSLRAAGATVDPAGAISQPFFMPEGQVLTVNGEDVQAFEFASKAEADAIAETVSADGSSVGTSMTFWVASPHFYKAGRLIVIYVGSDSDVINMLQEAMGSQFAGR